MLALFNKSYRSCDGVSRRGFLQVGALGLGGLTLADLLRAEARAGVTGSRKAMINIFLGGGPSHTDMFDLKPDAPVEFRGEFNPIPTNVPGMHVCEHMPALAKMAEKFAVIRSIVGSYDDHSAFHTLTGFHRDDLKPVGGRPPVGSVVSRVYGTDRDQAPPFVSLMGNVELGYLGPVFRPYTPDGPGRENLRMHGSLNADRLRSRSELLGKLDAVRRNADRIGEMQALDAFTRTAVDVVAGGKLAEALDLGKEDPAAVERYIGPHNDRRGETQRFLLARRLIEAGVRCVTLNWGGWDTHGQNFDTLRRQLPALDRGLSALLQDLDDRRMLDDVTVVMWGEFGRTPRVNATAGRDHWARVMQAFVAGGGMKTGQVIGSTDRVGGEAVDRPVHLREVFATLYHNLGIDVATAQFMDPAGRPQYLTEHHRPMRELV